MARTKTLEEFVAEAIAKYGTKYGYDAVVYINTYTKVSIYCFKHGSFERKPQHFLAKAEAKECPDCMKLKPKESDKVRREFGIMHVGNKTYVSTKKLAKEFGIPVRKFRDMLERGIASNTAVELLKSDPLDGRQQSIRVNGKNYASRKDAISDLKIPDIWLFDAIASSKNQSDIKIDQAKIDELHHSRKDHETVAYLKPLLAEVGLVDFNDCYKILRMNLPSALQEHIRNGWPSYVEFLEELFPGENIEWWRLPQAPRGFWETNWRRIQYMTWLENKLKIDHPDGWYNVTTQDLNNNYGGTLLLSFSQFELCQQLYPEHKFLEFKFNTPKGFWLTLEGATKFLDYVRQEENWLRLDDLHDLTNFIVTKHGGSGILNQRTPWGNSIWKLVNYVYPNYAWRFWDFSKSSSGLWDQKKYQLQFVKHLEEVLNIKQPSDWYNISVSDIQKRGGQTLLHKFDDSLGLAIISILPDLNLDLKKFIKNSKVENRIGELLIELAPNFQFIRRYKHPNLIFPSGRKMELDFYCAELSMAIEYDGEQHFRPIEHWGGQKAFDKLQVRDKEKTTACKLYGISLIRLNLDNWDGTKGGLTEHLNGHLPT